MTFKVLLIEDFIIEDLFVYSNTIFLSKADHLNRYFD